MRLKSFALFVWTLLGSAVVFVGSACAQETLTVSTIHSSGTNVSILNAQAFGARTASGLLLFDAAVRDFNVQNSDTILQDASSFTAGGQHVSPKFFPFGSYAVAVNSNLAALGSLTASGLTSTNYFCFQ